MQKQGQRSGCSEQAKYPPIEESWLDFPYGQGDFLFFEASIRLWDLTSIY